MLFQEALRTPALGLFALNGGENVRTPAQMLHLAALAEDLGYESIWMGEHSVLPAHPNTDSPFAPRYELSDPLLALAQVAAVTSRVKVATGVLLLPLRHPVLLAKELASLDHLSGGRVVLGYGMGYIPSQNAAFDVPFDDRSARGLEYLEAMHAIWASPESASSHGRYVDFTRIESFPAPVQRRLNTVAGGHSNRALRSAVTHADGWFGFGLTPEALARALEGIEAAAVRVARPDHLGPLEITVTPPRGGVTVEQIERFRAAGAHRLVLWPPAHLEPKELEDFVRRQADVFDRARGSDEASAGRRPEE
ncbi:MAG TPA: TIGR03619 family F420-dependent LLM class oxidoreductase [Actinospica sp.]|nr:TIGR03619 family F420-dependent LLM class oxidoreductase [Actinospica sp.]